MFRENYFAILYCRWLATWACHIRLPESLHAVSYTHLGDAEKDREGRQWEQRIELMRDAIIYNRNNPVSYTHLSQL